MKKFLIASICLLVLCLSFWFGIHATSSKATFTNSNVIENNTLLASQPDAFTKRGKKSFAMGEQIKIENNNQTLKVLFNNKTFLLNLKNYEYNSAVHTTQLKEQKFARRNSLDEKLNEIEKIMQAGFTLKESFNIVCPKINADIEKIYKAANVEPLDATIKYNTATRQFNFTSERVGYKISESDCYNLIFNAFRSGKPEINLRATELEPTCKLADFQKCTNLRGSFSTNYANSTPDRKHNIRLALKKFNGLTLMPGETISFNSITGERTEKTGYKTAKVILNGAYTEGAGGGVCQASTTLYNACLVSDIEVVTSAPHSLPASYVKPGFDAMVSYGISDLVIKNTTDGVITFATEFNDTTFKVKVYGLSMNGTKVEFSSEIVDEYDLPASTTVSAEEKDVEPNTIVRPAFKGFAVQTYALYKKNGKIYKTQKIRLSRYKSQGEIIAA